MCVSVGITSLKRQCDIREKFREKNWFKKQKNTPEYRH